MNPLESFEKQLKESADMQVDHSASFIWEDLSKAIKPKKKKRRALYFWLLFSAVLTSGIILLLISEITNIEQKTEGIQKGNTSAFLKETEPNQRDPLNAESDVTLETAMSQDKGEEGSKILSDLGEVNENLVVKKEAFNENNNSVNINKKISRPGFYENNKSYNSNNPATNNNAETQINFKSNYGAEEQDQEILNNNAKHEAGVDLTLPLKSLDPLASLTITPSSLTGFEHHENIFSQPQCPTFRKKRFTFFAEIEGLAGIPIKHMNSGPEASKLYELRKSSEKPWYSAGAGLHFGIMYRNKLSVSTGLDWWRVNEKFDYSKTDIVDLIYHVDPNTGYVTGPFIVTKNITNSGQIRHTLMDIPVLLGYQMKSGGWNMGIQAGPFMNVNLTSRGKIMTAVDQVGQIKDQNSYKNAVGLGLQGSLAISRNLTNNMSLYLKPSFKYYLNDWTSNEYPIRTKFNNASVSIGVRQTF